MLCKTRGIVLHSIPYNDKYSIIYMYTEAFGRASYLVARSRGKKSSVSKALFMPLSVVEMEVEHLNKRDLHRIRETKLCYPLTDVFCNPVKNILALFLSEILFRVVKETEPDSRLFEYLFESIQLLELSDKGVANFHLCALRTPMTFFEFSSGLFAATLALSGDISERRIICGRFLLRYAEWRVCRSYTDASPLSEPAGECGFGPVAEDQLREYVVVFFFPAGSCECHKPYS